MGNVYLGIDIGTSACKTALYNTQGNCLDSVSAEYPVFCPRAGYVEQHADQWWRAVCSCLRILRDRGADLQAVEAVGVDGQSWAAVPIDRDGDVLANTPLWMDTRNEQLCQEWASRLGAQNIFRISKNPFTPGYTLPKVLGWIEKEPDLIQRTERVLQCKPAGH